MLRGIMGCSRGVPGLFRAVPVVFRGVPGCSGCVPGCSGFYRHPCITVPFKFNVRLTGGVVDGFGIFLGGSGVLKGLGLESFFLLSQ